MENLQTNELNIIRKLMSNGINHLQVQDKYILPANERPRLSEVSFSEGLPLVDLKDLDGPYRSRVLQEIGRACEEYGFFQIVNHGVPDTIMKSMMGIAKEFFEMPVEHRACLYSEDRKQQARLSTSFDILIEKIHNWRDYLIHPCHPVEEVMGSWPEKPAAYREITAKYVVELRTLCLKLLAAISEALGLDSDYLNRIFGKSKQMIGINYYPPCPNPDLTIGIAGHSDSGAITVLMQGDVNGLQVRKNGRWVAVEPIPNAFVVNLGDQMQVVSNGRFRSVEHRAVTNTSNARISIPTFWIPAVDALIAPAPSMVDEQRPPLYREYTFEEFNNVFRSNGLTNLLDYFKIEDPEDSSH